MGVELDIILDSLVRINLLSLLLKLETQNVNIFSYFPSDHDERLRWIKALPNANLRVEDITKNMGICEKHWPSNVPKQLCGRHLCPSVPPSCFSSQIPQSSLPTAPATPRSTSKALSSVRTIDTDETKEFLRLDSLSTKPSEDFHQQFLLELSKNGSIFNLICADDGHVDTINLKLSTNLKSFLSPMVKEVIYQHGVS